MRERWHQTRWASHYYRDFSKLLERMKPKLIQAIQAEHNRLGPVKVMIGARIVEQEVSAVARGCGWARGTAPINNATQIRAVVDRLIGSLKELITDHAGTHYGEAYYDLDTVELKVYPGAFFRVEREEDAPPIPTSTGRSNKGFKKEQLIPEMQKKKSLIWLDNCRVKGWENKCFLLATAQSILINKGVVTTNTCRVTPKTIELASSFKLPEGMSYDTPSLDLMDEFEELNQLKIHIFTKDVQCHGMGEMEQSHNSAFPNEKWPRSMLLHYIDREKELDHMGVMTDLNVFKVCRHRGSTKGRQSLKCLDCARSFKTRQNLAKHECKGTHSVLKECLDKEIHFDRRTAMNMVPVSVVYDIEADNEKQTGQETHKVAIQSPLKMRSTILLSDPVLEEDLKAKGIPLDNCWTGYDCTAQFMQSLVSLRRAVADLEHEGKDKNTIRWTVEDRKAYKAAKKCHICDEAFGCMSLNDQNKYWAGDCVDPELERMWNLTKCAHHDHLTHKVRGAAHRGCNLKDGRSEYFNSAIPIVAHNARGYDAHAIILALSQMGIEEYDDINVIPQTSEKYLTFKVLFKQGGWCLKFIDWMAFQPKSLEALVKTLPKEKRTALTMIAEGDPAKLELCLEKMPMFYEHITGLQVLEETKLPPEGQAWYSTLRDKQTSHEDVVHAQKIWNMFQCKTINDFLDVYLKVDMFGLRDVIAFASNRDGGKTLYGRCL